MMTIKIKTTDLVQNEYLKDFITRKVMKLNRFLPKDFGAIVEVELAKTTKHHKTGNFFRAEIQMVVPGGKMLRSVSDHDTMEKAVAESVNNFIIELDRYKDKMSLEKRKKLGKIKNKAFG